MRIVALVEQYNGKLSRTSAEVIACAQQLARNTGKQAVALVAAGETSGLAGKLAAFDLAEVIAVQHEKLAVYNPDELVPALAQAIKSENPYLVVAVDSSLSWDYLPRLSARLEIPMISGATAAHAGGDKPSFARAAWGGRVEMEIGFRGDPPFLVALQVGAWSGDDAARGTTPAPIRTVGVELPAAPGGRRYVGTEESLKGGVDLGAATRIVAVGRGFQAAGNVPVAEALAKVLHAEVGASRPVVDSGWLPRDRQIGSSGQTVEPTLYFAIGVSGAIQHLVGMKTSKCIVAINKDPDAPIFEVARYGIVGDLFEIVPELTKQLQAIL
ncbi:MAG: electron transfer flavoprotein subunit alpha/FixB family protein [Candidatus Schekmanbacteria bacterium]|nr:electron transfer flavoprotein subunit alpha/FixB family protein [Candidatus Schekmanbacteria bacterium]